MPRGFEAIGRLQKRQIGSLPNGENYGVARNDCFRAGSKGRAEPPLCIEYGTAPDYFEASHLAILPYELLRAERRMDLDPLDQAFFNLFL